MCVAWSHLKYTDTHPINHLPYQQPPFPNTSNDDRNVVGFVFPAYESFRAIEEGSELGKIWCVSALFDAVRIVRCIGGGTAVCCPIEP